MHSTDGLLPKVGIWSYGTYNNMVGYYSMLQWWGFILTPYMVNFYIERMDIAVF